MPNKLHDPYRHKSEKAKYKIGNSREYDQALKNRGSLTLWFSEDAIAGWNNIDIAKDRKRGRPSTYYCATITLSGPRQLAWPV